MFPFVTLPNPEDFPETPQTFFAYESIGFAVGNVAALSRVQFDNGNVIYMNKQTLEDVKKWSEE